jgi:hypothetical protein
MFYSHNQIGSAKMMVDALLYPQRPPELEQYLADQFRHVDQYVTPASQSFFQQAQQLYTEANRPEVEQFMHEMRMDHFGVQSIQYIVVLNTADDFQQAGPTQQRWLMACPELRVLAEGNRINAWADTYSDVSFSVRGRLHEEWRMLNDGVVEFPEKGPETWENYPDELAPSDRPLTLMEKVTTFNNWARLQSLIQLGKDDPTDPCSGSL